MRPPTIATPTFSGAYLDRGGGRRTDERWVAERHEEPATRAVAAAEGRALVVEDGQDRLALARFALGSMSAGRGPGPVLLGLEDGRAVFGIDLEALEGQEVEQLAPGAQVVGLREAGARLSPVDAGLAAYAATLLAWHRRNPRCSWCGARTEMGEAGHVRCCPSCNAIHHPRTDPVAIMLVLDGDRVLLGRQPSWPEGFYSALAGFVEPGESVEEAVVREVREESGVEVRDPRYVSSQPWPFPGSLMLGFVATYRGGEAAVGDDELDDVRWFTREEVAAAAAGEVGAVLRLPPPVAIARRLLSGWLGEHDG